MEKIKDTHNVLENLGILNYAVSCDHCYNDITKISRIFASGKDYCIGCFANLDYYPQNYIVIKSLNSPLFVAGWTANDEWMMVQALQKYGYGNWNEISEHMNKKKEQIEIHFEQVFLGDFSKYLGYNFYINPDKCKQSNQLQSKQNKKSYDQNKPNERQKNHELPGYNKHRGQFDYEYDDDLELILAEMKFCEDDSPQDIALKYHVIDIYCSRLKKRYTVKDFVINRGLLSLNNLRKQWDQLKKPEREIHALLRPFARYITSTDYNKLVANLAKERELRQKLQNIITKRNPKKYETSRHKRQSVKKMKVDKNILKKPLLNVEELDFCSKHGINQLQYIYIKETLIREYLRTKSEDLSYYRAIFKIRAEVIDEVFEVVKQQFKDQKCKLQNRQT